MQQAAPYARPVSTEADESGADGGTRQARPSSAQVAQGVIDLLGEVDEAFSSDRWAILNLAAAEGILAPAEIKTAC